MGNICQHEEFDAKCTVERIGDPVTDYSIDVHVKCRQCGQPFRFKGLGVGVSFQRPLVSIDGEELRAPIEPSDSSLISTEGVIEMPPASLKRVH